MKNFTTLRIRWTILLAICFAGLVAYTVHSRKSSAQGGSPAQVWTLERVAHVTPITNCGPNVAMDGLAYDSLNQPVVAWAESNECGGGPHFKWARKTGGVWTANQINNSLSCGANAPDSFGGQASLTLGADGMPFLIYEDIVSGCGFDPSFGTVLTNLATKPNGPGTNIDFLGKTFTTCYSNPSYVAHVAPGSATPNWVDGLRCTGIDGLRLNGGAITDKGETGFDYAIGPAGQNHLIFSYGGPVYYNNGTNGSDLQIATINRFSGDVQIAADANDKLHAIIRGYDSQADFDLGLMGYVTSTDGLNWSAPFYIDTTHVASKPALALDQAGNPAVAYWLGGELRFAYLTNGQWSNVHVISTASGNSQKISLAFDQNNAPVIAFYDLCSSNVFLATPAATNQPMADLALSVAQSPDPVPVGSQVTYTIKVNNNGDTEATDVVVTDTLPVGMNFVSASPAPFAQTGNTFSFDMGIVTPASNCSVITIVGVPTITGNNSSSFTVTSKGGGPGPVTTTTKVWPTSCFPPPNGLVSWLTADGNAQDYFGGHNGSLQGGVTFAPGEIGQAFNLNGTDAYVQVPDSPAFDPAGSFSINAWVNTTNMTSGGEVIVSKYECGGFCPGSTYSAYFLSVSDGKADWFIRDTNGSQQDLAGVKLVADGKFHHLVGVRDLSAFTMSIYVDGVLDASSSLSAGAAGPLRNDDGTPDNLIIGGNVQGGASNIVNLFSGLIDDVTYYNRALSAAEVQGIFSAPTICGAAPTAAPGTISGQVTTNSGSPLPGVTMALSGAQVRFAVTDSHGRYSFGSVESEGFYSVTPALGNYTFAPANLSFSLLANKTDAVFTAIPDAVSFWNPIDSTGFFVRQQYLDFLGREPDQDGFEYWTGQINQCHDDNGCVSQRRIDVSAAFFASAEFQQTGYFVYLLHKSSFAAQPGYLNFSGDRAQVTGGFDLEAMKTAFAEQWVTGADFLARYPLLMAADNYVDALNSNAGAVLTVAERAALINGLGSGTETRATVLRKIADNPVFQQNEYNAAFVLMQYFGYLRRDMDLGGYNFWLDVLNNRARENFRGMVCAFITSDEYQDRFGSVHTHSNAECGQ